MSCENTNARLQIKYTTVAGQVPTIPSTNDHNDGTWNPTDIYIGEFFLNSEDDLLWVRTLDGILVVGGTGGSASFSGDFVSKANGGTYSGPVFAPTFSAINMLASTISASAFDGNIFGSSGSVYYGDGSNLTGITTTWNGGTVSLPSEFNNTVEFNDDITINNVYSGTLGYVEIHSDVTVNGGLSASYFIGDGSLITNLPVGPTANDYTTNAYLDGNIIRYDRTDLADAYSVDLSPILFTQSVASFDWDSSTNDATITINDGSLFTINLGIFNNISTAIINATDVYASNFYGTFTGTFSNDIYTTGATLSGTTAIFDRTDGVTYSLDLSSIAGGGGNETLEQTLILGNTIGTQSINLAGTINMSGTDDGLGGYQMRIDTATAGDRNNISMDNSLDGVYTRSIQDNGVDSKMGSIQVGPNSTYISNTDYNTPSTFTIEVNTTGSIITDAGDGFGLRYDSDYSATYLDRSLVDKAYVDLHGATGLAGVLAIDNTTGTQSIFISSSASQIQGYNGINQHWYDAGAPFVGLGDYYQIENNSGGGETQSYIRFYDEGDTMIENNELYDTINSPANQDAKKTRFWLRPQTIRFNADNQDFDTNTFNLASELTINADAFTHETHDILNDCTAQIVASTDGTGTFTAVSLQAYHYGGASASKVIVAHDYITNRVDANVGTGTGPFTLIEQTYTDIIVSGTPSFPGVTYDRDYSATFTNRSLVDKEYVDNAAGSFVYITENTTTGTLTMSAPTSITSTVTDGTIINEDYNGLDYSRKSYDDGLYTTELILDPIGNFDMTQFGEKYTGGGTQGSIRFSQGGQAIEISTTDGVAVTLGTQYNLGTNDIVTTATDITNTTTITQTPTSITVTMSSVGIEYGADYSSTYTNRSLVDKEYVDNASGTISRSFGITIDGGGTAITTGTKGYIQVPFSGTITGWTLLAHQVGSIVIDVWKDTFTNFPPTVADTIAGTEKPTITAAIKNEDTNLTTWNTTVNAGDIIAFNVDSVTSISTVNLSVLVQS